jgi:hypothetical protein
MPMQTDYSVAPSAAVEGQIACRLLDAAIDSCYNADSGRSCSAARSKWGSATDSKSPVKLPNAETDKIKGITVRTHSIDFGDRGEGDDTNGVEAGGQLNVMTRGTIWVKVPTGCAPWRASSGFALSAAAPELVRRMRER